MGNDSRGRMTYIDAMKGILIIMVVMAHSMMNTEKNINSEYAIILNFIAIIAIPGFFFINGYLYNHNYSLTPVKSIIKKCKVYYVPFVGFNLFFLIFHNVFVILNMTTESLYGAKDYIKHFFLVLTFHLESDLSGPIWFLRALLIMVCIYICLDFLALKVRNRGIRYLALTIIVITMRLAGIAGIIPSALNLNRVFIWMIFFYLGVVVREFGLYKLVDKHTIMFSIVGMAILLITTFTSWSALGEKRQLIDLPGAICGILGVFALSKLSLLKNNKILIFLGNASLDIMCLHFCAFKLASFIIIKGRHLELERLSEIPVLRGTRNFDFLLYIIVALSLCSLEYLLRTKVRNRFK